MHLNNSPKRDYLCRGCIRWVNLGLLACKKRCSDLVGGKSEYKASEMVAIKLNKRGDSFESPRSAQAGGTGVEPIHTDSESAVLPLDEPPLTKQ